MNRVFTLSFLLFITTFFVCAQIRITEVMYDPSGSDTGREWVEVQNVGGSTINFTTWKFFEANVNHGIEQIDGYAAELAVNEYGVVVSDKAKFLTDFPSFSGKIFKSSFSLSNTGEALAFKNDAGVVVDQYLYDVALGGAGDGTSLQKTTTWTAALPTPGTATSGSGGQINATSTVSGGETTVQGTGPAGTDSESTYTAPRQLFGSIATPHIAFVGADTILRAQAFVSGGKNALNPLFTWNFGDGAIGYGSIVTHRYKYPGTYHVALEIMASVDTVNTSALEHVSLVVIAPDVSVSTGSDEQGGTYVRIENKSKYLLDISSWVVRKENTGGEQYVFPKNTFIAPFAALRIPQEITQFKNDGSVKPIEVLFPNKGVVARYDPTRVTSSIVVATSSPSPLPLKTYIVNTVVSNPKLATKTNTTPQTVSPQEVVATSSLTAQIVLEGGASSTSEYPLVAAVAVSRGDGTSVLWYILPLLVLIGVAGIFLRTKKEGATSDEYTIIDDGK